MVTEICKAEVTEPRNGKVIFKKFTTNILLHVCMFMTMDRMFVHIVLAKNVITYPFMSSCLRIQGHPVLSNQAALLGTQGSFKLDCTEKTIYTFYTIKI